ncbi:pyridoxine 5'-phosphate synthase [Bacteroidia bacterium]|nr:pyridoxine 5'-phosphate synthase [Bacteroidia bacterium]
MAKLSVNINKVATLRNARGGEAPNVAQVAVDCQRFGAQGITVHPRPDERHIRYSDVLRIAPLIVTEYNIEGYPSPQFMQLVTSVKPTQVTLVPDAPDAVTSSAGWDTIQHKAFLQDIVKQLHSKGIRSSIFVDADVKMVQGAAETGTDRIELYTEPYAAQYKTNPKEAVAPFVAAVNAALQLNLEINAGHDLNLDNLHYFVQQVPQVSEVSIGHALICDALYYGLENTIQMYLQKLKKI